MYARHEDRNVESVCYKREHIGKVIDVIIKTFPKYFNEFIAQEGKIGVTEKDIKRIAEALGVEGKSKTKSKNIKQSFKNIILRGVNEYERDRPKYLAILDGETLEEYKDDPPSFKSRAMRNECPIINSTLNTRAKALEKYKKDYNLCNASASL
jgi:hypothetical protein